MSVTQSDKYCVFIVFLNTRVSPIYYFYKQSDHNENVLLVNVLTDVGDKYITVSDIHNHLHILTDAAKSILHGL